MDVMDAAPMGFYEELFWLIFFIGMAYYVGKAAGRSQVLKRLKDCKTSELTEAVNKLINEEEK